MPRRARVTKRVLKPDPKYNNNTLGIFINKIMERGKKTVARRIVYDAFDIIEEKAKRNPLEVFEQALKNATPLLEVKPRRVGGATYQVPVEVKPDRGLSLAIRWILGASRGRSGRGMAERLATEVLEAANNEGSTIKKKADTHKMAEANRAFVHYRW
ncbi:MAG: 30S ribosomal protein S7 [Chloroflexi bacterium]|nr:30S ribosomal protein S7 [Chloroflexota bacterium]